jgi:TM2 domain-containing membrane protein YozV
MNCAIHAGAAAVAYCRNCGKALCNDCRQEWGGVIFCPSCAESQRLQASVSPAPPSNAPSPALAAILGFIPGVGAIYNGQYAKGIIHAVVFGMLISILSSGAAAGFEPLFGILTTVWYLYMPIEAYNTAKKRAAGEPVDEFSGLFQVQRFDNRVPVGPIALILLGVVFLFHSLGVLRLEQIVRFWPVLLIAAGTYMLYVRLTGRPEPSRPAGFEGGAGREEQP